ncbi:MAG: hypothetical protein HYR94_11225, partial [Chloroflexi bacterium]|nr:hypothetical protein [Chloroflexota bacterium]
MTLHHPSRSYIPEDAWKRLHNRSVSERRWSAYTLWAGVVIILVTTLLSFSAPLLGLTHPNEASLTEALWPPSLAHPFGTDDVGRDIFTRM